MNQEKQITTDIDFPQLVYPSRYLSLACEYYNGAYAELHRRLEIESKVVYGLVFHSIELLLKGYVKVKTGLTEEDIRKKYFHEIDKLLEDALGVYGLDKVLSLTDVEKEDLYLLAKHKENKGLYYPAGSGTNSYPNADRIVELSKKIILATKDFLVTSNPDDRLSVQINESSLSFADIFFNAEHGPYAVVIQEKEELMAQNNIYELLQKNKVSKQSLLNYLITEIGQTTLNSLGKESEG